MQICSIQNYFLWGYVFISFVTSHSVIPSISICINRYQKLNDAYMCLWTMSILIQILACRLFSTKPLSKFRAHLAISPLYNSHVWVMSMCSSGRPVKNKCTEIVFNIVLFIICANLQYPKLFPLGLCFYQFCNKPQCNSFNFYLY